MPELSEIERSIAEAERATVARDHVAAERALRLVLKLQEADLGLAHPDVANTLNGLAVVCDNLGRPDEAEFLYRRALGIARRTLEPGHPYIVTSLENLSSLYRVQGKPEKIKKIREGWLPGSGRPVAEAEEAADGVVAPVVPVHPETAATAMPAPRVQRVSGRSQENRLRPIYAAASQPAFLLGGVVVVLMLLTWFLFGAATDPSVPGQDGAGTRVRTSGGELGTQKVNPTGELASRGSETNRAPAGAVAVSDSGIGPSAPAPTDLVTSTNVPPPERLTMVASDAPSESGSVRSSLVAAADICGQLDTRDADGTPLAEWRCQIVGDRAAPGQLSFYTRIRSRTSTTVEHRWLRNGVLEQRIVLDVEANNGSGFRTYSSHTVSPEARGMWRVELRLGNQDLLHVEEFVVP